MDDYFSRQDMRLVAVHETPDGLACLVERDAMAVKSPAPAKP